MLSAGSTTAAEVNDLKDGMYELHFMVQAAGPFQLALAALGAHAGGPVYAGICRPGRAAAQMCSIEAADTAMTAGGCARRPGRREQACSSLACPTGHDYGNRIETLLGLALVNNL